MKTKLYFLMTIALMLVSSLADAAIVSNSLVVDDIEYYIQTDNSVYNLGEDVEILFRVTNLGETTLSISTMYPVMDIIVSEKVGEVYNEIWNWSWDKIFPMGTTTFLLQPGESTEINGSWPQIDLNDSVEILDHTPVPAGTYGVSGYLSPTDTSVAMDITIVPEPCSILILGLGCILTRTKQS